MTSENRPPQHGDCGQDAAAYVLGALEADEVAAFRRHLDHCAICRDEVAALATVADALPISAPQAAAPRGLKRQLMKEVRADARRRQPDPARGPTASRFVWPALRRPALGAVSVAIAIAGGVGVVELASEGSSSPQIVHASVTPTGASAVLRLSSGHAELTLARMPAPGSGRIYEVWLKRGSARPKPTSALFDVTSNGAGAVDIPGDLRNVREVLVTSEPDGGSLAPTRAPVIIAPLSNQ